MNYLNILIPNALFKRIHIQASPTVSRKYVNRFMKIFSKFTTFKVYLKVKCPQEKETQFLAVDEYKLKKTQITTKFNFHSSLPVTFQKPTTLASKTFCGHI